MPDCTGLATDRYAGAVYATAAGVNRSIRLRQEAVDLRDDVAHGAAERRERNDHYQRDKAARDRDLFAARRALDEAAFQAAWARGQRLTLDQALAAALELTA